MADFFNGVLRRLLHFYQVFGVLKAVLLRKWGGGPSGIYLIRLTFT